MINKRHLIIAIIFAFCLALVSEASSLEEMTFSNTMRLEGSTHGDMDPKSTFICIDSRSNIHVSYYTERTDTQEGNLYHKVIGENSSLIDSAEASSILFVGGLSMDIDSHDNAHIVYGKGYHDDRRARELRYVFFNGTVWQNQVITNLLSREPSIKLDSGDKPHISYLESPVLENYSSSSLDYAYFNGSAWRTETVEDNAYIWSQQMAMGSDNEPQIAYIAGPDSSNRMLKYARFNGISWKIETVNNDNIGDYVSIAVDAENNPHISYGNQTLKYSYFDGTVWHTNEISQMTQALIEESAIGLSSQGQPHIFYNYYTTSWTESSNASYAFYTGTTWIISTVATFNATAWIRGISLALDSNDIPNIAYKWRVTTGSAAVYDRGTLQTSPSPSPEPTPTHTPTPSPSPTPTPTPTPTPESELFPTTLVVASITTVIIASLSLLFYFKKRKR
jgi:hypothetical protein